MSSLEAVTGLIGRVHLTEEAAEQRAWDRLDRLTKPPRSLGRLEELAAAVARMQQTDRPDVGRKAIVLAAGDHGVVAEGVSPYPQDVTWQMVSNIAAGGAAINQIAGSVGAELVLVDVGVARDLGDMPGVRHRKIAPGTANMVAGAAMTLDQTAGAILAGARETTTAIDAGVRLLGTGEMGIGNTTAAAALTASYTNASVDEVVGRGTGLDAEGVRRKRDVVRRALEVNSASLDGGIGTLAAVGGFEIAALAGVIIAAASRRTCVIVDGFISGAAALAAARLCPACRDYLLPSHASAEPGHAVVLHALGLKPVLELDMRLGEGTGAALAMGIVDAACRMLSGMATFEEAGVSESE